MTTQINTSRNQQVVSTSISQLLWVSPLAMLTSTVANLGLYAAAGNLYPEVTAWTGVSQAQIIGANIVYLLIGTVIFAVVSRRSQRPARNYWIVATVGLLLSLVMPITAGMGYGPPDVPPAEVATVMTLSLMHVLSYAISVPLFIHLGWNKSIG